MTTKGTITPQHMLLMQDLQEQRVVPPVEFSIWAIFGALSSKSTPLA